MHRFVEQIRFEPSHPVVYCFYIFTLFYIYIYIYILLSTQIYKSNRYVLNQAIQLCIVSIYSLYYIYIYVYILQSTQIYKSNRYVLNQVIQLCIVSIYSLYYIYIYILLSTQIYNKSIGYSDMFRL